MAFLNPHLYLADRSTELFFIFDLLKEQFIYMNPTCKEFFCLECIEVNSGLLLNMIHLEDRGYVLSKLNACIQGAVVTEVECRIWLKGYERWLRINPFLAIEDGERLLLGHAEDITSYKAKIEVLNQHNNKRNSILYILAHDLGGPIGAIGSLSTMLEQNVKQFNDPSVDRYINMISKLTKSCTKLIRDFIDQEFMESPGVKLLKSKVEIISIISLTAKEYFSMQQEIQIQFSCGSNKKNVFVEIDADKFMLVINNLLSNALKFTPEDGKINIYIRENETGVLITVSDNGIGIPKKHHATLFDKFSDARRSGLKGERSTGLGMSIIKTIVEWHDGKIWFDSEEGKGTTFFIQLPKM
jgi:two-component system sensor histidine kinase VicK